MRTRLTHQQQCQQLNGPLHDHVSTTYGLTKDSILNTSKYFHVCDGLVPDIMHDILEGSLQYEVKELLKHLTLSAKYLTVDELNLRIDKFPYVLSDKNSKPTIIPLKTLSSRDHSLKQKGNS